MTNGTNFKAKIKTIYSHSLKKAYHIKHSYAELTPLVFYIVAIQVAWFVILLFLTASAAIVNQFMLFHARGRDFALWLWSNIQPIKLRGQDGLGGQNSCRRELDNGCLLDIPSMLITVIC